MASTCLDHQARCAAREPAEGAPGNGAGSAGRHRRAVPRGTGAVQRRLVPLGIGTIVVLVLTAIAVVLRPSAAPEPVVPPAPRPVSTESTAGSMVLSGPIPGMTGMAGSVAIARRLGDAVDATGVATARPSAASSPGGVAGSAGATDQVGAPGARPVSPSCRGDAGDPQPGDVICFRGELDEPLKVSVGGTPEAPIVYSGDGSTRVPGITVDADNVVVQGFVSEGADSTGIWASGENVTVADNTVTRVRYAGDDVDGIRFFGDGFKVLHNTVREVEGTSEIGDSHVDCMQTYATSQPGSSGVVIQGNRCEGIRAQCLMAEGPDDDGGSGEGVSRDWLFDRNYCDAYAAAQSVALEDVQNVTISNNDMVGKGNKAFALGKDSTGAVVKDNSIGPGYGREVGFDDPSARDGYEGPPAE